MIITNLSTKLREVEDATIPAGVSRPAAALTFRYGKWTASVDFADPDEYQEQGEYSDRIRVQHFGSAMISVTSTDHPDVLIGELLAFVKTETPVPA